MMGLKERLRQLLEGSSNVEEVVVPKEWAVEGAPEQVKQQLEQSEAPVVRIQYEVKGKTRVPGLRLGKRVFAAGLLLFSLGLGVSTALIPGNLPMAGYFAVVAFYLLDYLWKTRAKPEAWDETP